MLTKSRLITVLFAVATIALINRFDMGKELLQGDEKFLGIF